MRLDLSPADPSLVPFGLRAAKTIATARGPLHPTQRSMFAIAQRLKDIDVVRRELGVVPPTPDQRGKSA